jgi:TusA-related sulfurtransferase
MAFKKLDARGLKCPMPIVKAKKELDVMAVGDQLEVTSTDLGSVTDFQGWVKTNKRASLKGQRQEKDDAGRDLYIHLIERTDG